MTAEIEALFSGFIILGDELEAGASAAEDRKRVVERVGRPVRAGVGRGEPHGAARARQGPPGRGRRGLGRGGARPELRGDLGGASAVDP